MRGPLPRLNNPTALVLTRRMPAGREKKGGKRGTERVKVIVSGRVLSDVVRRAIYSKYSFSSRPRRGKEGGVKKG